MPVTIISSATTTQVKRGNGTLYGIVVVSTGTNFSLQVKDGPDANGNTVTLLGASAVTPTVVGSNLIPVPIPFVNGLQIVTTNTAGEFDVIWA